MYIQVIRTEIDYTNINDLKWELKSKPEGQEIKGHLNNNFNGYYTAAIALTETNLQYNVWKLKVEIKDNLGGKFEAEVPIAIGVDSIPPSGTGDELELKGLITQVHDNIIQIRQIDVTINDSTKIVDEDNNELTFADLFLGLSAEVKAVQQEDGSLLANLIEVNLSDALEGEVELKGVITKDSSNSITVGGLSFQIDNNTKILDGQKQPIPFDSLHVGLFVKVKGVLQPDGTLLAIKIKYDEDDDSKENFKLSGPIEQISDTTIFVAGTIFYFDDETKIEEDDNLDISISSLQVGTVIKIKGEYRSDGNLWALEIEVKEKSDSEINEEGTIELLDNSSLTVNGILFNFDASTIIYNDNKQKVDFSTLQIGIEVEVKAIVLNDGSYLALRIKVKKQKQDEVKKEGAIQNLTLTSLTILQTEFTVDSTTVIKNEEDDVVLFSDLSLNMRVKVEGYIDALGNYFAEEIEVKEKGNDEIDISAPITALSEGKIDAAGLSFNVTEVTIIMNESEDSLNFSNLQLGQFVKIKATRLPNLSYLALRIIIKDSTSKYFEIEGNINYIALDSVIIEGQYFLTDDNTLYFDDENNSLTLDDFSSNSFVSVKVSITNDGGFLIVEMKLKETGSMQGEIESDSSSAGNANLGKTAAVSFYLYGIKVIVDNSTLIVGTFNTKLDQSYLDTGAVVDAKGTLNSAGDLLASSVKVLVASTVTEINDVNNSNLTYTFALQQNYPNPFNPTTTIKYQLPQAGFVSLKVYDILGSEVASLVNQQQQAGNYIVNFDASQITSGIYFYRLESNNYSVTKRMLLLK